jgi:hypothetical protein
VSEFDRATAANEPLHLFALSYCIVARAGISELIIDPATPSSLLVNVIPVLHYGPIPVPHHKY